ncbi:hypothetical protein KW801_03540 [Candidatus Saccharibacteria bacterium]|nr:hypothetical protein [Candidatus Saccharibacteria bacterium]
MISLAAQPTMNQLYRLIDRVPRYPLSIQRLLKLARDTGAPAEVVNFYKTFAQDQVFDNKDDLAGRTEQLEIIQRDESDMPPEKPTVPVED